MKLKRWALLNVTLLFAVTFHAVQLRAQTQTTGEITGVVTDPSGAAVVKATVALRDISKGTTAATETNKDGVYHFQLLTPSNYTVSVMSSGFQGVVTTLNVALGQVTTGDVRLTIGSASSTVVDYSSS